MKKKGGIFEWLDRNEKDKEELEMLKREKMNELYQKKMLAKSLREKDVQKS